MDMFDTRVRKCLGFVVVFSSITKDIIRKHFYIQ